MDLMNVDAALGAVSSYEIGSPTDPVSLPESISVAMLGETMKMNEALNAQLIHAMELSVNPNVGGNIDVYA